jgi:hypothetical protein
MTTQRILLHSLCLCALLLAGGASASTFQPLVDFRSGGAFEPAAGADRLSVAVAGTTMIVEAMTLAGERDGALYWDAVDGYGISGTSYEQDEIEGPEALRIRFTSPIGIDRFLLSDLFLEGRPGQEYAEQGFYSLDGGRSWSHFQAELFHPNGEVELGLPQGTVVNSILFGAPGRTAPRVHHEYSVAGFDPVRVLHRAATPEPGGALLFGAGLALFTGWRRRALTARGAVPAPPGRRLLPSL